MVEQELTELQNDLHQTSDPVKKVVLKSRIAILEDKKKYLALDAYSSEINDKTFLELHSKGYNQTQIEEIETALNEYRQTLRQNEQRLEDNTIANQKLAQAKSLFADQLKIVDNALKKDPNNPDYLEARDILREKLGQIQLPELELKDQSEQLKLTVKDKILSLRPKIPFSKIKAGTQVASGVALGTAVSLSPFIIDEASLQACKVTLQFKSPEDLSTFRRYGQVGFSKCNTEINSGKIWDLLLMKTADRNKLFQQSPTLCKAFENTFSRLATSLYEKIPEVKYSETTCESGSISTVVKIHDHLYPQKITFQKGEIRVDGSFISGQDLGDLKSFEIFSMKLMRNQEWSGLNTSNPTWASVPAAVDNFTTAQKAANPATFSTFDCENSSVLSSSERRQVNLPSSGNKLICAAHEQAMALKTELPFLLNYCEKKTAATNKQLKDEKASLGIK